jgi:hypothetical protein
MPSSQTLGGIVIALSVGVFGEKRRNILTINSYFSKLNYWQLKIN